MEMGNCDVSEEGYDEVCCSVHCRRRDPLCATHNHLTKLSTEPHHTFDGGVRCGAV